MGGLPSTKTGKLPTSLPKKLPTSLPKTQLPKSKSTGLPKSKSSGLPKSTLPSTSKPQYALSDDVIDSLIQTHKPDLKPQKKDQQKPSQTSQEKPQQITLPDITIEAAELTDLIDETYPSSLESSVDQDIANEYKPQLVTLAMLDAARDLYYHALDHQATCQNGSAEYWDAQKDISKRNALLIGLGQHWRQQQDELMRNALDRLTAALEKR